MVDEIEKLCLHWFDPLTEQPELYLVGGAVRDRLLGRPTGDLDLMCRDAKGLARRLAEQRNGVVVAFEKRPGEPSFRVVDRNDPSNYVDLASMKGGSLEADLARRDFTVNAMALPIAGGEVSDKLVDPFDGAKDIEHRIIRMTGPEVFVQDPFRILRAYRFAAELGFDIEPETVTAIKDHAQRLRVCAAERVLSELMRIYGCTNAASLTRLMDDTGVLEMIFPEVLPMKGCTQNSFHHSDVWGHSLVVLENCEYVVNNLGEFFGEAFVQARENLDLRNRLPTLKLSAILHDIGKPAARAVSGETGRITFYGHDAKGVEMAEAIGRRLKMSNKDRELLCLLIREHLHVLNLSEPGVKRPTLIRWFRRLGDDAVLVIILGMADVKGTLGPDSSQEEISRHLEWSMEGVAEYYRSIKKELERKDLIKGKDLMDELGMKPGPEMGRVLKAVRKAQDAGLVKDREEALRLSRDVESDSNSKPMEG